MPSDNTHHVPTQRDCAAAAPCCANVWDPILKAYRSCDEWADPASDSDLCTKHHERLTAIVTSITAAQTAARSKECEEQPEGHRVP